MAYATIDDVFKRYPPINTMVGSGNNEVASVDVASIYIFSAEGLVNAYVGAKYQTPLATPDGLVTMLAADIALYKMVEDKLPRIPDWAINRYKSAISVLENLRDGKMVLSNSQTAVSGGNEFAWSSVGSYHSVFSPVLDELDQDADPNYIEAELDARD